MFASDITTIKPTWTNEFTKPMPTCQVAEDLSPICTAVYAPGRIPEPTARPICGIAGVKYSAYHWPKAKPTGANFCDPDWTVPMGTLTIPGVLNKAVVSGFTLSSPDVYHFFKDVRVEAYRGQAGKPGGLGELPYSVWNVSTTISAPTIAQPESNILQASKRCIGIEGDICSLSFAPDFRIQDLATVRVDQFKKYCPQGGTQCLLRRVLYSNEYHATIAIPISEAVRQNSGLLQDCDWPFYETNIENRWNSHTKSSVAVVLVKDVMATAFVPITTAGQAERITPVPSPGLPLRAKATPIGVQQ
ncbi:hypothetical protein K458DRAFT_405933 [Lentithecium fluviatile CBS 122367]|uniref:Uncharacterized protein n=1 Tax=Lentithecium fluviatile CBS 122367 TaxID=1168545 RepID=A0A6G1IWB8_9PLEO|nr:hypothetical protein K458DRAFT_405933 [Lentithecium fluviatile CBS 122367]